MGKERNKLEQADIFVFTKVSFSSLCSGSRNHIDVGTVSVFTATSTCAISPELAKELAACLLLVIATVTTEPKIDRILELCPPNRLECSPAPRSEAHDANGCPIVFLATN